MLLKAGIDCRIIVGNAGCFMEGFEDYEYHAWNIVDIDGSYYHVDVTWDDPITDRMGGVNHSNFLLSDSGLRNADHNGWDNKGFVCSNTKYDNCSTGYNHICFGCGIWYCCMVY